MPADYKRQHKEFDLASPTALYIGYGDYDSNGDAPATSAAAWTIQKITLTSGNPTRSSWTLPGHGVWDNRATETYY